MTRESKVTEKIVPSEDQLTKGVDDAVRLNEACGDQTAETCRVIFSISQNDSEVPTRSRLLLQSPNLDRTAFAAGS